MRLYFIFAATALCTLCVGTACGHDATNKAPAPPNIVLILADDLGYRELGSFWGFVRDREPFSWWF